MTKRRVGIVFLATVWMASSVFPVTHQENPVELNDIARAFPKDVVLYVNASDLQNGAAQLKEMFVRTLFAKKGEEWWDEMVQGAAQGIKVLASKVSVNAEDLFPSIRSGHAVVTRFERGKDSVEAKVIWAVEFSSAKPVGQITASLAKVMTAAPQKHGIIYNFNRDGDSVSCVGIGSWLIGSNDPDALPAMLERVANPSAETLADHPSYQEVRNRGAEPGFTGFADLRRLLRCLRLDGREDAFRFDRVDAMMGLSGFQTLIFQVGFKDKKLAVNMDVRVQPETPLYQILRQEPGASSHRKAPLSKDGIARIIPAQMPVTFLPAMDLHEIIKRVESFIHDHAGSLGFKTDKDDAWKSSIRRALGVHLNELDDVLGEEIAFTFSPDLGAMMFNGESRCAMVVQVSDVEKAKKVWKKIQRRVFWGYVWVDQKYKGVTLSVAHNSRGDFFMPRTLACAWVDGYFVLGMGESVVREFIDTWKDGQSIVANKDLRKDISRLKLPNGEPSVVSLLHVKSFYEDLLKTRMPVPHVEDDLTDRVDVSVLVDTGHGWSFTSEGTGGALLADAGMVSWTVTMLTYGSWMRLVIGSSDIELVERVSIPDRSYLKLSRPAAKPKAALTAEEAHAIRDLIFQLGAPTLEARDRAVRDLAAQGEKAVPLVVEAMTDRDPEIRVRAEMVLADMGRWEYLPEQFNEKIMDVVKAFEKTRGYYYSGWNPVMEMEPSDWRARAMIYYDVQMPDLDEALEILKSDLGVEVITRILTRSDESTRLKRTVLHYARRFDTRSAGANLIQAVRDPDAQVRAYALSMLGASTDRAAVAKVLESLKSSDLATRRAAFLAAERSKDPGVAKALVELLTSEDTETRFNADYTLSLIFKQDWGFNTFSPKKLREAAVNAWREAVK